MVYRKVIKKKEIINIVGQFVLFNIVKVISKFNNKSIRFVNYFRNNKRKKKKEKENKDNTTLTCFVILWYFQII